MSVIAEFSVPADEFVLGDLLEVRSGVQVRLESMIPMGGSMIPYFWVGNSDVDAVEAALQDAGVVEEVRVLDELGEETLFRVQWTDDVNGVIEAISKTDAVILSGEGLGDAWRFQVRFPQHDALSAFYHTLVEEDITVDLHRISNTDEMADESGYDLTPDQRIALLTALEMGYFDVPRRVTLIDVAEELGVSDSATSQRIRRGLRSLLHATLLND